MKILCVFLFCLVICSCSFFGSSTQNFSVSSSEADAEIYINGDLVGQGNIQTRIDRGEGVSVLVRKKGFYPASRDVRTTLSSTGIVDMIGGCIILLPFFGLMSDGAWELEQPNITILLEEKK